MVWSSWRFLDTRLHSLLSESVVPAACGAGPALPTNWPHMFHVNWSNNLLRVRRAATNLSNDQGNFFIKCVCSCSTLRPRWWSNILLFFREQSETFGSDHSEKILLQRRKCKTAVSGWRLSRIVSGRETFLKLLRSTPEDCKEYEPLMDKGDLKK